MTKPVIDGFEVVDIDHDACQIGRVLLCLKIQLLRLFQERTPVETSGEGIPGCQIFEFNRLFLQCLLRYLKFADGMLELNLL